MFQNVCVSSQGRLSKDASAGAHLIRLWCVWVCVCGGGGGGGG